MCVCASMCGRVGQFDPQQLCVKVGYQATSLQLPSYQAKPIQTKPGQAELSQTNKHCSASLSCYMPCYCCYCRQGRERQNVIVGWQIGSLLRDIDEQGDRLRRTARHFIRWQCTDSRSHLQPGPTHTQRLCNQLTRSSTIYAHCYTAVVPFVTN